MLRAMISQPTKDAVSKFGRRLVRVGKGITWVAGLGTAVIAIGLWFPPLYNQVMWREVEYGALGKLSAGNNSSYVDSLLGTPAIVKGLAHAPGLTENIYVRRDHFVMTIVDESRRVLIYSVLSCDQSFAPSFKTPYGTTARLQSVPLAQSETSVDGSHYRDASNDRRTTYTPAMTVSSLGQLIELGNGSGSNSARAQSWFVGVNSACGDTYSFGVTPYHDKSSSSLPKEFRVAREQIAANFYAETVSGDEIQILNTGNVLLGRQSVPADQHSGIFISPHPFELPVQNNPNFKTHKF